MSRSGKKTELTSVGELEGKIAIRPKLLNGKLNAPTMGEADE